MQALEVGLKNGREYSSVLPTPVWCLGFVAMADEL